MYGYASYEDEYGGWYTVAKDAVLFGACNKKGELIVPCKYNYVSFNGDSYTIKLNNPEGWGACDINGKEIIPPIYKSCLNLKNSMCYGEDNFFKKNTNSNYFLVKNNNGEKGLIDHKGKTILECKYSDIETMFFWFTGLCKAAIKGKYGLYDSNGEILIPHIYDDISFFGSSNSSNIFLRIKQGDKCGLADIKGNVKANCEYDWIYEPSEGLMICCKNSKKNQEGRIVAADYGYLAEDGTLVIPCKYQQASDFKDGVAQVVEKGVASILTNPLTGTSLNKLNGGGINNIKVDKNIPQTGKDNQEMFAFIVTCENYIHLSGADYSINDGKVFKDYCSKTLGLPEKSIRYFEDATFGNLQNAIQKIKDIADVFEGDAKIIFYFSGLGATDPTTQEAYLLPTDASLSTITTTGYSVTQLNKELGTLNTQNTIVILDAPFSGTDKTGKQLAQHRGVLIKSKKPIPQNKLIVLTSSSSGENSFSNEKYGHSLLTYALLDKLQQSKGNCTLKEWVDYAISWVKKQSLLDFDKVQTPEVSVSERMTNDYQTTKF